MRAKKSPRSGARQVIGIRGEKKQENGEKGVRGKAYQIGIYCGGKTTHHPIINLYIDNIFTPLLL
jgi:hypothetical protein